MSKPDPPAGGTYLLAVRLSRQAVLTVGRLGAVRFPAATYLYVGSARRGLSHRLARHARLEKRCRWHVDYLTAVGQVCGAWIWPAGQECTLAEQLAACPEVSPGAPGFGCSDCHCPTHLFRCRQSPRTALAWLRRSLPALVTELSRRGIIHAASRRQGA